MSDLRSSNFDRVVENINRKVYEVDDDIKQEFEKFRNGVLKNLDSVSIAISNAKKKQEIAPVMKWGQSLSEVFISVKLSHRFDAPGCLELIRNPEARVENGQRLILRAECVQATSPMIFVLDFDLLHSAELVSVTKKSVGTYEIHLRKGEETIWEDLFADFDLRNKYTIKVWYELEDVYPEAMEEFYEKMSKFFKRKKEEKKKQASSEL